MKRLAPVGFPDAKSETRHYPYFRFLAIELSIVLCLRQSTVRLGIFLIDSLTRGYANDNVVGAGLAIN
jgi:hypothetical protein